MSAPGPKPPSDEKMERHFNGIVMSVLALIAIAIFIVALFIRSGTHSSPKQSPPQTHPAPQ